MDAIAVQLRTKVVQLGLQLILFLQMTSYLWPHDTSISEVEKQVYYDYIIVGCGTAGSILANRLTQSGEHQVLVIEAGGDPPMESIYPSMFSYLTNSKYDWNFTTINDLYTAKGHRNHVLHLTSGKMLGGDSSLGHQLYVRGDPHDYDLWAEITKDQSWNYQNLLPYFKRSENLDDEKVMESNYGRFHGTKGSVGVTRDLKHINKKYLHAFKEAGNHILMDGNGDHTLGYYEPMFMVKDGIRQSTPYAFLTPIRHRRNLHLMKHTEAIEINFVDNKAVGVTAVKNNKKFNVKAKKEVIISAGAHKTPQLLMLSGIGLKDHLRSYNISVKVSLPVGKYYQDHLSVILVHKLKIHHHKSPLPDPHEYPLNVFIGNVAVDKSKTYPEYQSVNYIIPSDSDRLLLLCSVDYSYNNELCQSFYNQTKGHETMVSKILLLHPSSRGHVLLQSNDYKDQPMILSGFFSHDDDLKKFTDYIADFLKVTQTSIFKKFGAELVHPSFRGATDNCENYPGSAYWKCYALNLVGSGYHYTSTCSMGRVVDNRLKVYGTAGLRVVDASVIPAITSGDTQAAVMAVAEKAADMILEDANRNKY
ncbi:ecdysone oxidase-like [Anticarsia gemmatalis]|uniref:ecdysone oxidase-like n=1 Tax=Anticarsia gemmatalis TaxID=129554 RepID=UPI003F775C2B